MTPYYSQDGVTIHLGDNVETMSTMPSGSIDLVVTSPPYDNLRTYGGHSWDFPGAAAQLTRLLKPGGVIVWVVADATIDGSETGTSMRQALHFKDACGLNLHDTMIYRKSNYLPLTHNRYEQSFEFMYVFARGGPKTFTPLLTPIAYPRNRMLVMRNGDNRDKKSKQESSTHRIIENVWTFKCGGGHIDTDGIAHLHPAPFPEALARDHILSWSNPGDTVLDPFSGSGTTCKMAKECGRLAIGIEINQAYCDIAVKRLAQGVLFGASV